MSEAIALLAHGVSQREVARKVGISAPTIGTWAKKFAAQIAELRGEKIPAEPLERPEKNTPRQRLPMPVPKAHAAPPPDDEEPLDELPEGADTLAIARHMHKQYLALARRAQRDGNHTAAARALRDAGEVTRTIAGLEKASKAGGDVVTIPRHEIKERADRMREQFAAILSRPLLCSECSRLLSTKLGTGSEKGKDDVPPGR